MSDAAQHPPRTEHEAIRTQPGRGRDARGVTEIPRKGWFDIVKRVIGEVGRDSIMLIAAGVAFYGLLALFPAVAATMAIAALVAEPDQIVTQLEGLSEAVPPDVADLVLNQAVELAGSQGGGLSLAALLGFAIALWSASAGVGALMQGVNVAYDEEETRGFVKLKAITLGLTLLLIVGVIVVAGIMLVLPIALQFLAFAPVMETLIQWLAYVPMGLFIIAGVTLLYRFGPDRSPAQWRWLTPGAVVASVLWLLASIGFSIYVQNFGSYNETFGSLAGVIVALLWMWISAVVILVGAELNAEAEAQTAHDTTTGPREPMGHRGAVKADTLGETG
jgi:membrane protein